MDEVVDDAEEDRPSSSTDSESGVVAWSPAAEAERVEAVMLVGKTEWEDPRPPREPSDPEAIRKYCGRTSVSGRESSSRSYASSTVYIIINNKEKRESDNKHY